MTAEKIVENGVEEEEPTFSDEEGYVDEITDEDLIGDVLSKRPEENEAIKCCVIIDGIPIVNEDKFPKLQGLLGKLFAKFGAIQSIHYPKEESGSTKGYVFVEFASKAGAERCLEIWGEGEGYKLDRSHTLKVNSFDDVQKLTKPDENWVPPKAQPYNKEVGDLRYWLKNSKCLDQYCIQFNQGEEVSVCWNNLNDPDNVKIHSKHNWTETVMKWSPHGTYLASFHAKGVAVWAGEKFVQLSKYAHDGVQWLDFSPNEKYLVTYSHPREAWVETQDAIRIWEVRTGAELRTFPANRSTVSHWPHFKWSSDDRFFACMKQDEKNHRYIFAYQTYESRDSNDKIIPRFAVIDREPVKVDGVRDIAWSPKDPVLAYWAGEQGNIPARVTLMQFPSKQELRAKNIVNVADAQLYWQPSGDHFAVKLNRYGKKKMKDDKTKEVEYSSLTYHLEIFRVRQKDIPMETMEVKGEIQSFAWEPTGNKFCVLQGSHLKAQAVFYKVTKDGIQSLKMLDGKQGLNTLLWAPAGGWIVIASVSGSMTAGGSMVFVDASGNDVTIMNEKAEHQGMTGVCWDPTGRYLCSFISVWDGKSSDLGYRFWNFQGREIHRQMVEKFCNFSWRPRPPTLLNEKQIKEVKNRMRNDQTWAAKFEAEDSRDKNKATKEVLEKRQKQREDFERWRQEAQSYYEDDREERMALRNGLDTDDWSGEGEGVELDEEHVEMPLTRKETIEESAVVEE